MPRMGGIALLMALKKIAPHIPVVLMTGINVDKMQRELQSSAAAGFLPKPFRQADLENILSKLFGSVERT